MRSILFLLVASTAFADPKPASQLVVGRPETIHIQGHAPPTVQPKPKKNYLRIAPPYSDYAIEHDSWGMAYLLLDIDSQGTVERVKLLKHPGYDLDQIAIDTALKLKFTPAQDASGKAIGSQLIWPIEWPSYWWMVDFEGLATRMPLEAMAYVPCRGSGPMHLGSIHPAYRDCEMFKPEALNTEPWVERK
ncbi:MAG: energy transducer TonB [Kofleriaceae bacterium]